MDIYIKIDTSTCININMYVYICVWVWIDMLITTCLCEHSVRVYLHVHTDCKSEWMGMVTAVNYNQSMACCWRKTEIIIVSEWIGGQDVPMGATGQGQARCAGRVKPDERWCWASRGRGVGGHEPSCNVKTSGSLSQLTNHKQNFPPVWLREVGN